MHDGCVELLRYCSHGEHVVSHEEGRRPSACPDTPLTQRAAFWHAIRLKGEITASRTRERCTNPGPFQQCNRCSREGTFPYTFHLLFAHDERRAGRDAVRTVRDGARQRLAHLQQRTGHLRPQEVFLQMTKKGFLNTNVLQTMSCLVDTIWLQSAQQWIMWALFLKALIQKKSAMCLSTGSTVDLLSHWEQGSRI